MDLKLTNEIKGYIEKKGGSCQCFTSTGDDAKHAAPEADAVAPETECVLVLGGDGTLIRAASKLVEQNMALIGVTVNIRLLYSKYQPQDGLMVVAYYHKLFQEAKIGRASCRERV